MPPCSACHRASHISENPLRPAPASRAASCSAAAGSPSVARIATIHWRSLSRASVSWILPLRRRASSTTRPAASRSLPARPAAIRRIASPATAGLETDSKSANAASSRPPAARRRGGSEADLIDGHAAPLRVRCPGPLHRRIPDARRAVATGGSCPRSVKWRAGGSFLRVALS